MQVHLNADWRHPLFSSLNPPLISSPIVAKSHQKNRPPCSAINCALGRKFASWWSRPSTRVMNVCGGLVLRVAFWKRNYYRIKKYRWFQSIANLLNVSFEPYGSLAGTPRGPMMRALSKQHFAFVAIGRPDAHLSIGRARRILPESKKLIMLGVGEETLSRATLITYENIHPVWPMWKKGW